MGLLEIGGERKRSSHRLIWYQSNVGRVKNAHCSPIMLNETKNEAKNERLAATIFGTLGSSHMCATRVHCMIINVLVCIVHGSKQCHMQLNVECFWNSIETIYVLTLTTAMKFFSFIVYFRFDTLNVPWRFRKWYCCRAIEFICPFFKCISFQPVFSLFFSPSPHNGPTDRRRLKNDVKKMLWENLSIILNSGHKPSFAWGTKHTMTIYFPSACYIWW